MGRKEHMPLLSKESDRHTSCGKGVWAPPVWVLRVEDAVFAFQDR